MLAVTCGGAAIAGHLFPVYLKMRGGKGVATGAGVVFAMNWMTGLGAVALFLLIFAAFRYVSLGSIVSALPLAPLQHFTWHYFRHRWETPWPITIFLALLTIVVIVRHRDNIGRLRRGEERRISFGKSDG